MDGWQEEFRISHDPLEVDHDAVWRFLSTDAYWGRWRSRDDFEAQVASAWRIVGAYALDDGRTVGFARAISDGKALAYLADVFVLPEHRGRGLGHAIVRAMIDDGPGRDFRWMLHTADAHGVYAAFGFVTPDATMMERAPAGERSPVGLATHPVEATRGDRQASS